MDVLPVEKVIWLSETGAGLFGGRPRVPRMVPQPPRAPATRAGRLAYVQRLGKKKIAIATLTLGR